MSRDELDILECRLTQLEDCDVTHVLVEATPDYMASASGSNSASARPRS
jgi:hypothetical protein